jgi:hypothetical protein
MLQVCLLKVPVEETLKTKLKNEQERIQQFNTETAVILELPEVCVKTTFFQVEETFCD